MNLVYLSEEQIPKIRLDFKIFDRYGKPTEYTKDLFKHILKLSKMLFEDRKKFQYSGHDGLIHTTGVFRLQQLYDEKLCYGDLLSTDSIEMHPFIRGLLRYLSNDRLESRAGKVLSAVVSEVFRYNQERYKDQLEDYKIRAQARKTLEKISYRKYHPDNKQIKIDEKEGPRLLSLYRVVAASNFGSKDLTQKLFKKHIEVFPEDEKHSVSDIINQIAQYQKNKTLARNLFKSGEHHTLSDLMFYTFFAFVNKEMELLETLLFNPNESVFIHKLIILLYPFIKDKNNDFHVSYKFLLASLNVAIQTFPEENTGYNPEILRLLPLMVEKFRIQDSEIS